jgi:hypothetical protein
MSKSELIAEVEAGRKTKVQLLEEVKIGFDVCSDMSTFCLGYRNLVKEIESLKTKRDNSIPCDLSYNTEPIQLGNNTVVDINTPFFGNSGAKIPITDVNFHLVNAIRLLDNEQLEVLADSIYARIPSFRHQVSDEEIEKGIREYFNSPFLKLGEIPISYMVKGAKWMRDQTDLRSEEAEYVYQFKYNSMIHEGGSVTMSLHKTIKGAEMAMEFHKSELKKEWDDMYKDDPDERSEFGHFERWSTAKIRIEK